MTKSQQFPSFDIKAEQIPTVYREHMSKIDAAYEELLKVENPTYESMSKISELDYDFELYINQVSHLYSVQGKDDSIRKAHESMIEELQAHSSKWSQNPKLYEVAKKIAETDLTDIQSRIINKLLLSFKNSGIDLPEEEQKRFVEINTQLSKLSMTFSSNVLSSADETNIDLVDDSRLAGVLPDDIERFKMQAEDVDGIEYRIMTNQPDFIAIGSYAEDEELRKEIYMNYQRKGSVELSSGNYDNSPIMKEILTLRQEKAKLLGYNNYAELSLSTKMAESPEQVIKFLEDISEKAQSQFSEELKELKEFAVEKGFLESVDDKLSPWNGMIIGRLFREEHFNIKEDEVRKYFPTKNVQDGLFWLINELWDYKLSEVDFEFDKYHEDLKLFKIEKDGVTEAYIYADLYARMGKRGGAWMSDHCFRTEETVPVAFVTCNFTPPVKGKEATLNFNEVVTLFHEFGHALHHTLTKIEDHDAAGISGVPWDAVELPSTFMEFFCMKPEMLKRLSSHVETGETLPDQMIESIIASEQDGAAMFLMRQMELSLADIIVHTHGRTDIDEVSIELKKKYGMQMPEEGTYFYNQFSHIFAGGYAAGYYSYKWADILASDIFATFDENGVFCKESGKRYLDIILSQGSSREILDMFRDFKGAEPNPESFLKYAGIKTKA